MMNKFTEKAFHFAMHKLGYPLWAKKLTLQVGSVLHGIALFMGLVWIMNRIYERIGFEKQVILMLAMLLFATRLGKWRKGYKFESMKDSSHQGLYAYISGETKEKKDNDKPTK